MFIPSTEINGVMQMYLNYCYAFFLENRSSQASMCMRIATVVYNSQVTRLKSGKAVLGVYGMCVFGNYSRAAILCTLGASQTSGTSLLLNLDSVGLWEYGIGGLQYLISSGEIPLGQSENLLSPLEFNSIYVLFEEKQEWYCHQLQKLRYMS